ncbi:MAG: type II toxin-antitoxin system PemK/MazF family toxin [Phascolarctobacterium faecium]|uniref:type II toxin-antitoxin system PemK/MazF family toxin n=1 Tax=Phascolarctobacterium faecium TaxID=33025 RepID=UPI00399A082B
MPTCIRPWKTSVLQNDTGNKHAPTLIVATVTTRIHKKANMPTHFVIYDNPAFKEASVVQLEQIRTIDKSRIDNYLGKVTPREMVAIEKALSVSLAMEQLKKRSTKHKAKKTKE